MEENEFDTIPLILGFQNNAAMVLLQLSETDRTVSYE